MRSCTTEPPRVTTVRWYSDPPDGPSPPVVWSVIVPVVSPLAMLVAPVRLRVFADAYELDESQRRDLVPMLARRTRVMRDFLARQAAVGVQPWAGLWERGHGAAWQADADYIEANEADWAAALLG